MSIEQNPTNSPKLENEEEVTELKNIEEVADEEALKELRGEIEKKKEERLKELRKELGLDDQKKKKVKTFLDRINKYILKAKTGEGDWGAFVSGFQSGLKPFYKGEAKESDEKIKELLKIILERLDKLEKDKITEDDLAEFPELEKLMDEGELFGQPETESENKTDIETKE